jgi:hypothetical protein
MKPPRRSKSASVGLKFLRCEGGKGDAKMQEKRNKRIGDETRKNCKKNMGYNYPEERQSGRTTGKALYFVGKAMTNPGVWIEVTDHLSEASYQRRANQMCLRLCMQIIRELKLDFFLFRWYVNPPQLMYDVFETED